MLDVMSHPGINKDSCSGSVYILSIQLLGSGQCLVVKVPVHFNVEKNENAILRNIFKQK
jgi:hypothetical protein